MTAVEILGAGRTEQFVGRRIQRRGVGQKAVPVVRRSEHKRLGLVRTADMVVANATVMGLMIEGSPVLVVRRRGSFGLVIRQADFCRFGSMRRLRQRRSDEGQRQESGHYEAQ